MFAHDKKKTPWRSSCLNNTQPTTFNNLVHSSNLLLGFACYSTRKCKKIISFVFSDIEQKKPKSFREKLWDIASTQQARRKHRSEQCVNNVLKCVEESKI